MALAFLIVACILFVVAAFLEPNRHTIGYIGLAFFAGSFLVGRM